MNYILKVTFALAIAFALTVAHGHVAAEPPMSLRSTLPLRNEAKTLLDATHHHGEWIRVPGRSGATLAAVNYPDRRDAAPVIVIASTHEKLTPWLRAVADQVTSEGFITVVPDALTGTAEVVSIRDHLARHPAANGTTAEVTLGSTIRVKGGGDQAEFALSKDTWPEVIAFLNRVSGNDVRSVVSMPVHVHPQAQQAPTGRGAAAGPAAPPAGGRGPRGYPAGKLDELPAGLFTARSTVLKSQLRAEWVDIPMPGIYTGRMRTRITYPEGTGRTGIVVVMQHGPGADDWMQALGDQLSRHGFIALMPDLHTGFGPNGGGYESFDGPDGAFAANARLQPAMTIAAYKAVREYGLKLPRANGKSGAIGFCMGGGNAWRLASEVPALNASVVYYGTHPPEDAFAKINAPIIGFYGEDDARVTATVAAAKELAAKHGKSFEPHIYPHTTHGFLEFQDLGGNPEATQDSWTRTVAFLRQHLQ